MKIAEDYIELASGDIETTIDSLTAIQNSLIGGNV